MAGSYDERPVSGTALPPKPQVSLQDTVAIIAYVRELQRENGIFYKPHRM